MELKNYKSLILEKLDISPMGLTITEISGITGIHRNTVSKYVGILEAKGLIDKKEVSRSKLYFSKKRKYLPRELVASFFQSIFGMMKEKFPKKEEVLKEMGFELLDTFSYPLSNSIIKEFEDIKSADTKSQLKLFQDFYNSFDLFQTDIDITLIELLEKKAVYRLSNSEFLKENDDYVYFYYLVSGLVEALYLKFLNIKANCNIENINVSTEDGTLYLEMSLEIQ